MAEKENHFLCSFDQRGKLNDSQYSKSANTTFNLKKRVLRKLRCLPWSSKPLHVLMTWWWEESGFKGPVWLRNRWPDKHVLKKVLHQHLGSAKRQKKRKEYNCFLFACLGVNLYTVNLSLHTGELLVGCKAVVSPFDTIQGTHPSAVNAEKRKPASKQYWYPAQFPDPILNKDFFSEPVLLKHWDQALKNLTVSSRKHLLLEDKIVAHQNNLLLNTCSGILN